MIRMILHIGLLLLLNVSIGVVVLTVHDGGLVFAPWEIDALMPVLPEDESRDVVLLGSSHGYVLSRFRDHHAIVETETGLSVFNMSMPSGGGVRPARIYLDYYFDEGNTAEQVCYLLDPFAVFGEGGNDGHKFVYFESFRPSFLMHLIKQRYPARRILTYVQSKFTYAWWTQDAELMIGHEGTMAVKPYTPALIQKRMDSLYQDGLSEAYFEKYSAELEAIMARCVAEGSKLTLIMPPTLLGEEPGEAKLLAWLAEKEGQYDFTFHDWVDVYADDLEFFYDLDHLNTNGVERFVKEYLGPVLQGEAVKP